jgi:hypothetical protein
MTCERGVLDVTALLGPTVPARIQFVTVAVRSRA